MADEAVEGDEPDVFEIDDFTSVSDWERFINRIEEILGPHGWNLDNTLKNSNVVVQKSHSNDEWILQSEGLKFSNFHFLLSHYKLSGPNKTSQHEGPVEGLSQALIDSFDFEYDFPPRAHCLSRWYGLKEFLLLSPSNKGEDITSLSRTNLLWSSVGIALSNLKCQCPMFIQVHNRWRLLYYGMCIGGGFRTSYEMIQLTYTPRNCNHVQGMIETFQSKLACSTSTPISVSVRFTYTMKDWPEELWCQDFPDPDSEFGMTVGISSLHKMPFGPMQDPIKDLQLAATWPCLSSDILVDDANFSDLDPSLAPQWTLKARNTDNCRTLISQHLKRLCQLCEKSSSSAVQIIRSLSEDFHGDDGDDEALSGDVSHVLDRLAEPVPALASPLASVVSKATRGLIKTKLPNPPIAEELLIKTLEHLFPDAWMSKKEASRVRSKLDCDQRNLECDAVRMSDKYRHMKSAPVDSLTYMLAICITIMNCSYGGIDAVAHLWHEFVLELRFRLDNIILLPRLAQTVPNLHYCLFHQKLQMLNYCIKRKLDTNPDLLSKDQAVRSDSNTSASSTIHASVSYKDFMTEKSKSKDSEKKSRDNPFSEVLAKIDRGVNNLPVDSVSYSGSKMSESDDSDDEFFEAREEVVTSYETLETDHSIDKLDDLSEIKDEQPDGVMEETNLQLLLNSEPLRIPITQEAPPFTEDTLVEQEDILTQLGTSKEAAEVRAKMQSASLVSDMAAFKAANPGCILEDFVRWYSPNDWLPGPESEEEKEELSRIIKEKKKNESEITSDGWEFELDDETDDVLTESAEWLREGHLSLRMRVPDNTWRNAWNTTKSTPARLQKRLFDDTKEAEKVLHFFSSLTPSEVALYLFPVAIHSSLVKICQQDDSSKIPSLIENIIKETSKLDSPSIENLKRLENIVEQIHTSEVNISQVESLRLKFSEEKQPASEKVELFIQNLLNKSEIVVKGGAQSCIGKIITSLLQYQKEEDDASTMPPLLVETNPQMKNKIDFPKPTGQEYILRTTVPRPSENSRPSPQRLFTVITQNDFRMAGSFTQDTTFI